MKPGLERISGLLDVLAEPQTGYPILHVAGTNGKTSTVRMAARLVSGHGLTPGTFTSPHLQNVEERYGYGLRPMSADEFAEAMTEIAPLADLFEATSGEAVTYFELTAALAFSWFAEKAVDVAVVEAGLGGRLDATNAARSNVAVVTTIGLEHTAYLGDTRAAIAAEKLAILDDEATLVTGDLHPEAVAVAQSVVGERANTWFALGRDFDAIDERRTETGWSFDLRSVYEEYTDIELRLHGRHQVDNFATAVASVEALFGRALDEAGVREAAATVLSPGRMEVVRRDPLILMDGAHNPEAASALSSALESEFPGVEWTLVFGVMGDKDLAGMLAPLGHLVGRVHTAAADSPRAVAADEVARGVARALDGPAEAHGSVAAALDAAVSDGRPVLVTGSIYVVGEARSALGV